MGLHDPRFAHAACGLAGLARLDGRSDHELVERALLALRNLEHRGATGADPDTGDGAGILTALPDGLLRRVYRSEIGGELPPPGHYGVGMVFLPRDPALRLRCEELCVRICAEEGHRALGWRDVPVQPDEIGTLARAAQPFVRQLFVERRGGDADGFERALYVIRRRVELAAAATGVPEAEFIFISLSARRMVHKGLLKAGQLAAFYPELTDPGFTSPLAVVHSRFSTNTLGTWDLAHPFDFLAHNGEINTVRGNGNWLSAREPQLSERAVRTRPAEAVPDRSTSAGRTPPSSTPRSSCWCSAGRSLPHALAMLIPPAWTDPTLDLPDDVRAFHEFHASAGRAVGRPGGACSPRDGRQVVATLDRNGLRPVTLAAHARRARRARLGGRRRSPIDPAEIVEAGRARAGADAGRRPRVGRRVRGDAEIKRELAARRPYRALAGRAQGVPRRPAAAAGRRRSPPDRAAHDCSAAFGYTERGAGELVRPRWRRTAPSRSARWATTRRWRRSRTGRGRCPPTSSSTSPRSRTPPIDPQREALVMSLRTSVGAIGNLLGERPDRLPPGRDAEARAADERAGEARATLRARRGFRARRCRRCTPVAEGPAALERAVDGLCRAASRRCGTGRRSSILSDRGVDDGSRADPGAARHGGRALAPRPRGRAHDVRPGRRVGRAARDDALTRCCSATGRPRSTRTWRWPRARAAALGELGELTRGRGRERYVAGRRQGPAQGLLQDGHLDRPELPRRADLRGRRASARGLVERYFPGTVSRVGGIELDDLARRRSRACTPARSRGRRRRSSTHGGEYRFAPGGERHAWDPDVDRAAPARRSRRQRGQLPRVRRGASTRPRRPRPCAACSSSGPAAAPLPLDEVEPSAEIVQRFATGAMSLGSISPEAHETLAIAMNRLGGRSNTGEGGEDPRARCPTPTATCGARRSSRWHRPLRRDGAPTWSTPTSSRSRSRRARSPARAASCPGHKVDARIAAAAPLDARRRPDLAAAAPRHLLDRGSGAADPRPAVVNPAAEISVKLVAEAGVGTIAAGVAKAGGRAHRDRRPRRRHRRLAAVVAQARRPAVGARPRRGAAGARHATACAAASGCRSTAACAPAATC